MKLYEQISEELRNRIERGFYSPGSRLPSIRSLSRDYKVSIATAQEAYHVLEEQGLVHAKPKSGYFVQCRPTPTQMPSVTRPVQRPVEVSQWSQVMDLIGTSGQTDMIRLGYGAPDFSGPTLKPLQRALNGSLSSSNLMRSFDYESLRGSVALRTQIARRCIDSGCQLHPDDVVITTSCQEALSISIRAIVQPGDVVAVDSPSFYGSMQAIKAFGLKAMEIPTDPVTGISLDALEMALEQWPIRLLQVTPTCNNPLGYTMPQSHRQRLIKLAQRYDLAIIEDDIYGDLSYEYPRPHTLKAYDTDGRVLLCSSFSKTIAPGIRVGWVAPGRYREQVQHMKYVSSGPCAPFAQDSIAEFMAQGYYDQHLRQMRAQYEKNRDWIITQVERDFPAGTRISYPQGGFLLWIELPGDLDSLELEHQLRGRKISIAPGILFSASGKYRHCIRLNYARIPGPEAEAAITLIGQEATRLLLNLDNGAL
ncbi:MAG: PLP-dependent aminotransferase family protein [Oceanospirillaceae bacterium]|uniref:aminotransferase-like domain-containing protein n=1 Tax=Marinobacterium litorale TaxID=404770 RepID=UPI00041691CB|nr:PLP-dependent aminotransferase family protein [Marinobacterium litorale]MBT00384.1 PLP-dependent aminotransferase family protein [Oceanospirillaceae bacterium]